MKLNRVTTCSRNIIIEIKIARAVLKIQTKEPIDIFVMLSTDDFVEMHSDLFF